MQPEKRKGTRRRVVSLGARIATAGTALMQCKMVDVCDTGARLLCAEAEKVPDTFKLILSHDSRLVRDCRVVWRSSNAVGVEFTPKRAKEASSSLTRSFSGLHFTADRQLNILDFQQPPVAPIYVAYTKSRRFIQNSKE
jgi:hypothetical protein